MKKQLLSIIVLFATIAISSGQNKEYTGGWKKYENNPVLGNGKTGTIYDKGQSTVVIDRTKLSGGKTGTLYDVNVLKNDDGTFRMYCSWFDGNGVAISESADGLKWSWPEVCISYRENGYNRMEDGYVTRPVVLKKDGNYRMWYTRQAPFHSWVGYAESPDGKKWERKNDKDVLVADAPWEKGVVLCSQVIWDEQEKLFKMWYSGGDRFDPDAIGYATSKDGLHWEKYKNNPIFTANKKSTWEQSKVAGCQVIKRANDYLMFYIGYMDDDHAQIGMARSKDGITNWVRYKNNPIIKPGEVAEWDSYSVYKPFAVPDPANNRWLLYYNGRQGWDEQIGVAIHQGMDLGF